MSFEFTLESAAPARDAGTVHLRHATIRIQDCL